MFIKKTGNSNAKTRIIWLHGWGHNHTVFATLSNLFDDEVENYLIDLRGFGQADLPPTAWGSIDYTKELIAWLKTLSTKKTIIVGHSFGGRIAIQAAQLLPTTISNIILIAASGLKKKRSISFKLKALVLKYIGKCIKIIDKIFNTAFKETYSRNVGSSDYRATHGIMRKVFLKIIHEDLSNIANQLKTPTLLIYGSNDQETPVQFGQCYNQLIENSKLVELPDFDHYNILSNGRHQVYNLITTFLGKK